MAKDTIPPENEGKMGPDRTDEMEPDRARGGTGLGPLIRIPHELTDLIDKLAKAHTWPWVRRCFGLPKSTFQGSWKGRGQGKALQVLSVCVKLNRQQERTRTLGEFGFAPEEIKFLWALFDGEPLGLEAEAISHALFGKVHHSILISTKHEDKLVAAVPTPTPIERRRVAVCSTNIAGLNSFFISSKFHSNVDMVKFLIHVKNSPNIALQETLGNLRSDAEAQDKERVENFAHPVAFQALTDGAMLVWESPDDPAAAIILVLFLLDFVRNLQCVFYDGMERLDREWGTEFLKDVKLRIALAGGAAWRVPVMQEGIVEYMGLPILLASQLQAKAKPHGLVAVLDLAPEIFMERCCAKEGKLTEETLEDGIGRIKVWKVAESEARIIRPRYRRRLSLVDGTLELLHEYESSYVQNATAIPLARADAESLFDARERWESQFAFDLASNVQDGKISKEDMKEILLTLIKMRNMLLSAQRDSRLLRGKVWDDIGQAFHSKIALLSSRDDGSQRMRLSEGLYGFTRTIYSSTTKDFDDYAQVEAEHRQIYDAIEDGKPEEARRAMAEHLRGHFDRAVAHLRGLAPERTKAAQSEG